MLAQAAGVVVPDWSPCWPHPAAPTPTPVRLPPVATQPNQPFHIDLHALLQLFTPYFVGLSTDGNIPMD